jgi:predicted transcriptional regulator
MMTLSEICTLIDGNVVCGETALGKKVEYAFASDLMSDVLTLKIADFILITGLANIQSVRTAEMSDLSCMVLCRGKKASDDMLELAQDNDMVVIESPHSLFKCSGILYNAGLKAVY